MNKHTFHNGQYIYTTTLLKLHIYESRSGQCQGLQPHISTKLVASDLLSLSNKIRQYCFHTYMYIYEFHLLHLMIAAELQNS